MIKPLPTFQPAFALSNKHLQTIYSTLKSREIPLDFSIQKFTLSDGDFVDCYWHKTNKQTDNTPLVVLFHGLAGNYLSPYIRGNIQSLNNAGFDTVLMHFRGCSGVPNLLPRSYHSGETQDPKEFLKYIAQEKKYKKVFAVGFSLGANMLLKLLGELQESKLITAGVAISAPMQLDICANEINKGISRYYQYRLVQDLNNALDQKYDLFDMQKLIGLKRNEIQNIKTFWEFDDAYTAPIHGFKDAQDYYTQSSAKQYLKNIKIPTLIVHAKDDPFMSPDILPEKEELSDAITLNISQNGGHVGFISGTLCKPKYWLEEIILEFLTLH
jgi:predicted alpha/beta-fold hydrolase